MNFEKGDEVVVYVEKAIELDSDWENCEKEFVKAEVSHERSGSQERTGVTPVDEKFDYFLFLWIDESCLRCDIHGTEPIWHDSREEWYCPFCT